MNVYQKLNAARETFHGLALKKTGHNKFAGYYYFELGDFLIPAMEVFNSVGLCALVSFEKDVASMTIVDVDKPEDRIAITSPMGGAALKGCHEVQNIGAVETYQRRYLWVAALEIVEHDALDATTGNDKPKSKAEQAEDERRAKRGAELDDLALCMIEHHKEGDDLKAIALWYDPATWIAEDEQDERLYVWGLLKTESKLRSTIKANRPAEEK